MRKVAIGFLWLFVFTIPFDRLDLAAMFGVEMAGTLTRIVGAVAFAIGITVTLYEGRLKRLDIAHIFLFTFILWAGISGLWSLYPDGAIELAITYAQLAMMVWLLAQFAQTREEQSVLMFAYVCGAFTVGGSLSLGFISGNVAGIELFPGRYTSFGYNPNDLALTLALGIPMAWYLFMKRTGAISLICFIYLPIALLGVFLSASRGGMLATIVALLLIPISFLRLDAVRRVGVILLIVIGVVGVITLVPEYSLNRLMTIDDSETTEWSLENLKQLQNSNMRLIIWQAGLDVFQEHPVIGVGVGGYRKAVDPVGGDHFVAHNVFISILVELGIIGLVLFLSMLVGLAYSTRFMDKEEQFFWLILLATFAIGGLFLTWEYTKQTWFIMSLIAARMVVLRPSTKKAHATSPLAMIMTQANPMALARATQVKAPRNNGISRRRGKGLLVDRTSGSDEEQSQRESRGQRPAHVWKQGNILQPASVFVQRKKMVVEALLNENRFQNDDDLTAFFDHLAERDQTWHHRKLAQRYFRNKLASDYPHTLHGWRTLASEWARFLVEGLDVEMSDPLDIADLIVPLDEEKRSVPAPISLFDQRRQLVVDALIHEQKFTKEDSLTAFFDYMVAKDRAWNQHESVRNYFRKKLKGQYPHTLEAWCDLAQLWAKELE